MKTKFEQVIEYLGIGMIIFFFLTILTLAFGEILLEKKVYTIKVKVYYQDNSNEIVKFTSINRNLHGLKNGCLYHWIDRSRGSARGAIKCGVRSIKTISVE